MRVQYSLLMASVVLAVHAGSPVHAQSGDEMATQANEAYAAEKWTESAELYGRITEEQQTNGRAWYRLGVSLKRLGRLDAAKKALTTSQANGVPPALAGLEMAGIQMLEADVDGALTALEQLVEGGFANIQGLAAAEEFSGLGDNPRYASIEARVRRNANPCEAGKYRDFDFWVGSWDVKDTNGILQGTNRISREHGGCTLHEQWTSATGNTGSSLNYYDAGTDTWSQLWVSNGLIIKIEGGLQDGAMRLTGTAYYMVGGNLFPFRGTWTPLADGRVRQFFEQSTDDGATWTVWFDGYYSRKEGT